MGGGGRGEEGRAQCRARHCTRSQPPEAGWHTPTATLPVHRGLSHGSLHPCRRLGVCRVDACSSTSRVAVLRLSRVLPPAPPPPLPTLLTPPQQPRQQGPLCGPPRAHLCGRGAVHHLPRRPHPRHRRGLGSVPGAPGRPLAHPNAGRADRHQLAAAEAGLPAPARRVCMERSRQCPCRCAALRAVLCVACAEWRAAASASNPQLPSLTTQLTLSLPPPISIVFPPRWPDHASGWGSGGRHAGQAAGGGEVGLGRHALPLVCASGRRLLLCGGALAAGGLFICLACCGCTCVDIQALHSLQLSPILAILQATRSESPPRPSPRS